MYDQNGFAGQYESIGYEPLFDPNGTGGFAADYNCIGYEPLFDPNGTGGFAAEYESIGYQPLDPADFGFQGGMADLAAAAASGDMAAFNAASFAVESQFDSTLGWLMSENQAGIDANMAYVDAVAPNALATPAGAAALRDANAYTFNTIQSVNANTSASYEASNDAFTDYLRG